MTGKKVVIAASNQLYLDGLVAIIEKNNFTKQPIFSFTSGKELIETVSSLKLDLLIIDLNLLEKDGFQVLDFFKKRNIDFKILVISSNDHTIIRKITDYQVDGLLLSDSGEAKFLEAIDQILSGNKYFDASIDLKGLGNIAAQKIIQSESFHSFDEQFLKKNEITKRELEVLKLLAKAHSNFEIGKMLFISEQTVTVHRKSLMRKLCVNNIAALMKLAFENNLV